jgi:hypothetical protein
MKKAFALSVLVLSATLLFAFGQARINFINNSNATVRFFVDGSPACSGDIIPGGTCTEYVSAPATHTLSAQAPGYEPISHTITVDVGDAKDWSIGDQK